MSWWGSWQHARCWSSSRGLQCDPQTDKGAGGTTGLLWYSLCIEQEILSKQLYSLVTKHSNIRAHVSHSHSKQMCISGTFISRINGDTPSQPPDPYLGFGLLASASLRINDKQCRGTTKAHRKSAAFCFRCLRGIFSNCSDVPCTTLVHRTRSGRQKPGSIPAVLYQLFAQGKLIND